MPLSRSWISLLTLAMTCQGQEIPVVTQAKDLYRLNRAEMLYPTPVRIRGVVTYNRGDEFNDFTMQDETGGLVADAPGTANQLMIGLVPGQEVVIEGVTMVNPPPTPRVKVEKLIPGRMAGLPAPLPFTPEALLGGAGRLCHVEFSGVIREAHVDTKLEPPRLILSLGPPGSRLAVWLARFDDVSMAALKPDTRVRVHGVSMSWTSANLQPYSTFVVVQDPTQIEVLSPPSDTGKLPVTPIGQLLSTVPEGFENRRQRISGTVTLRWSDEAVVIQDDTGGILSYPAAGEMPAIGDRVDCVGFLSPDRGRVILDESSYGDFRPGAPPLPELVSADLLLNEAPIKDRDALLVSTTGVFRSSGRSGTHGLIQVESEGVMFDVVFPPGGALSPEVLPGSLIEVTGVAKFVFTGRSTTAGGRALDRFEIHLPTMAGIKVLSAPSWWTPRRFAVVAGVILFCLLLSLLWVISLRRRVAARSALLVREIRARHEQRVLLEERARLAGDLHDTLSQSLSGAVVQMELADSLDASPAAETHRLLARRLINRSYEDLRRAVWDLTPSVLLNQDLPSALRSVAGEQSADHNCGITIEAGEDLPGLPERSRSHLLRICQEAIHNAIRHGAASEIRVSLKQVEDSMLLVIRDNGRGFDPGKIPGPTDGHFGLSSMRNRVLRLGGAFGVDTSPAGTVVSVTVPIAPVPDCA
ncbi:sensor histidine kinase [Luteolibacter sp. SL250]|uniref:sensor histidine kinase n=1 Tax=Luteolibacter sp. SL250 TaxID=2995170 RepID=UPI00227019BD|nr:sensor histidine kinase [Luteolibacter sp. SL250]WAC21180.1 sensor histidine kinase [Luteolibacter sp. SL250]